MGKANFAEDFKRDTVLQITERGYPVAEVAARLGISKYSLYEWRRRYGIRTDEGFAYVAVVIDLFSPHRRGGAIKARQTTDVVLQARLAAVWRRKPKGRVLVHSDQGSQFTSMEWASFLKHHDLQPLMTRRGHCHDNAVAESVFNLLKRERIRCKVYQTRDEARRDVFDYIEMFYNSTWKHARNGML
ncbi:IS3 family transposase [Xanthobacter autotrophicus DSM 431]